MNPVTLTPAAHLHIQEQMKKEKNAVGFYLAVKTTGCSGYAWKPAIVSDIPADALHFVTEEGLPIYIARDSADFVRDIVIDFAEDHSGLKQKRLVFINPRETGRCGCGESFTIKEVKQ